MPKYIRSADQSLGSAAARAIQSGMEATDMSSSMIRWMIMSGVPMITCIRSEKLSKNSADPAAPETARESKCNGEGKHAIRIELKKRTAH